MLIWKAALPDYGRGILGANRRGLVTGVQPGDWKYRFSRPVAALFLLESTARLLLVISSECNTPLKAQFDSTAWWSVSPRLNSISSLPSASRSGLAYNLTTGLYICLMLARGLLSDWSLLHDTLREKLRTHFGMSDSTEDLLSSQACRGCQARWVWRFQYPWICGAFVSPPIGTSWAIPKRLESRHGISMESSDLGNFIGNGNPKLARFGTILSFTSHLRCRFPLNFLLPRLEELSRQAITWKRPSSSPVCGWISVGGSSYNGYGALNCITTVELQLITPCRFSRASNSPPTPE